jgi:diguanylate cyclase (GGDEF)-like protein
MLRVFGCITRDHDLGLVALACLVCLLSANSSLRLLGTVRENIGGQRAARTAAAIAALAAGIWTTHFIGLLAYRPDLPSALNLPLAVLSLGLSVVSAAGAILPGTRACPTRAEIALGGLVTSGGTMLMHFAGMRSLILPVVPHYDPQLVAAACVAGFAFAIAALANFARNAPGTAAIGLTLSVAATHFVSMGSITLSPAALADGTPLSASRTVLVIASASGGLLIVSLALAGSILDRHLAARVARETGRLRALADATFEGLVFERGGMITDVNRAMCTLSGREADSLIRSPLNGLIKDMTLRSAPGQPAEQELIMPDGALRPIEVLWRNGPDPGGHVVAVRDMSREKAVQLQLLRMAQFDTLTGLINREQFELLLDKALAAAERAQAGVAVLYVDLDRFETVYEAFGARASDDTLVQTANRLVRAVRQTDTVGRLGRDEFAIIQPLADRPVDTAVLAARIVTDLSVAFESGGQMIPLTASVGVAAYPANGTTSETLIRSAAMAMRRSKQEGRATWRNFEPAVDLRAHERRGLEKDLRLALADGQFAVHYQTFFNAATLEVAGCEALVRWDHPSRGRISPADFIPAAEQNGMIVPIGAWVLATACAEAARWDRPVTIAVNLSPAQFAHAGIVASVADALRTTGLPPGRLELEITEGTVMADIPNARRILKELKALGVRIAMDDFGTGYSSLSYLRKLPFDKIKIDRSFLSDVDDDPEAQSLIDAIIAMGQTLRLDITAEGVETPRQLSMLKALGCTYVQGFLLGRPCPASQLDLSAGKPRWLAPAGAPSAPRLTVAQSP